MRLQSAVIFAGATLDHDHGRLSSRFDNIGFSAAIPHTHDVILAVSVDAYHLVVGVHDHLNWSEGISSYLDHVLK